MSELKYRIPQALKASPLPIMAIPGLQSRERPVDGQPLVGGRYGRIFPDLPPWKLAAEVPEAETLFKALSGTMVETPEEERDAGRDNPGMPAAYTYFGQFLTHDLTFDPLTNFEKQIDPNQLWNFRTPRLDLDCLYGRGPMDAPHLYERGPRAGRFLIGKARIVPAELADTDIAMDRLPPGAEDDLPRNPQGIALIGDPRNDENIIICQLHLAFLKFHNQVWDAFSKGGNAPEAVFHEAQDEVRCHYEWIVFHDFLPRLCGKEMVDEAIGKVRKALAAGNGASGLRLFPQPAQEPFLPVEFSAAAFRIGHSMVRSNYTLNRTLGAKPVFKDPRTSPGPLEDLRGRRPLPVGWSVDWNLFLETGNGTPQFSRRIDTKLSRVLSAIPSRGTINPLAWLTLMRGKSLELPSGQSVARKLEVDALTMPPGTDTNIIQNTPLWYYILAEAEADSAKSGRQHLGPVGRVLVTETLLWLALSNPSSILHRPDWKSKLMENKDITLTGIFKWAGLLEPPRPAARPGVESPIPRIVFRGGPRQPGRTQPPHDHAGTAHPPKPKRLIFGRKNSP